MGPPAPSLIRQRVAEGFYDSEAVRTFWILEENGERAGVVRLEDLGDETPMFHLRLRHAARNRGLGTHAVRWLTDHLFSTYDHVRRVEATTRQDNVSMRRVLRRCGYVKEAHYRDGWPGAEGEVHDAVGYAVLRTDWSTGAVTLPEWDDEAPLGESWSTGS